MKISELIADVGDDTVDFQLLDECATTLDYDVKRGTMIRFGTTEPLTPNGTVRLGIVVWLDRDAVTSSLQKQEQAA